MSNRSKVKRFVAALNQVAERMHKTTFEYQQLRQLAKELNIQVRAFCKAGHKKQSLLIIMQQLHSVCNYNPEFVSRLWILRVLSVP